MRRLIRPTGATGTAPTTALWTPPNSRSIRTLIPPRPAVTVVMYLDQYGNPIRNKDETDVSLIRTRENKFFLQRVFDDESVVRFACPGLSVIKHAQNFEYFTVGDIDIHGGAILPSDVWPTTAHDRPMLQDVVHVLSRSRPTTKFLRKDRRAWHRRLFAHWEESPEKFRFHLVNYVGAMLCFVVYVVTRYFYYCDTKQITFWNTEGRQIREDGYWGKARRFSDRHPEHQTTDLSPVQLSPAQNVFMRARSELRTNEVSDPGSGMGWMWKIKHTFNYGHWPKDINL